MSKIGITNVAMESFGCAVSLIIILCLLIGENRKTHLYRMYLRVLACNAVLLLCDAMAWMFKGHTGTLYFYGVRYANFWVFSLGYVLMAVFTDYLVAFIAQRATINVRFSLLIKVMCGVAILLVAVSQYNHMYYRFDANNMYVRAEWFWLSQVWGIIGMLVNGYIVLRYWRVLGRKDGLLLLSYCVLPSLAMVVQIWVYGLALLYIVNTFCLIAIYVGIQADQAQRMSDSELALKKQELELFEGRQAIMLSQIQPHFLYNALTSIEKLCDLNPAKAKTAINDFAHYLRGNLDSLSSQRLIPFVDELEHVETYLSLEQLRFGDHLRVEYDIQAEDFLVPPLSVQPIVENAVRYGITEKNGGGRLTLRALEEPEAWRVVVADDGVGFDSAVAPDTSRSHTGICNVRARLEALCAGTLTVTSAPGQGTTATITIPKGVGKEGAIHADHRGG